MLQQDLIEGRSNGHAHLPVANFADSSLAADRVQPMHRVLIVDDHLINRKLAAFFLSKMNCLQAVCDNGLKALNMVQEEPFDLVLMDVNMPVMDGLTATRAIRALQSRAAAVPIVVYSADVTRENRESSLLAGANVFLPKPVDFHNFRTVIQRLLPPVPH